MNYMEIVTDAIQYIEADLQRELSLEELASRYYISPMHFYRIFRAATNQTVKSYILGRRLSEAALALRKTNRNVTDIAFRYGFNSLEQFTRDFQKMFRITPSRFRKDSISLPLMEKMDVVERDFKNENKDVTVKYFCREIHEIKLLGKEVRFNPWNACELEEMMRQMLIDFKEEYIVRGTARQLYNIVRGNRRDLSCVYCFFGIAEEEHEGDRHGLTRRTIPASRYAIFQYPELMGFIFPTVLKDQDQWLAVTKLKKNRQAGIDMIELFPPHFQQSGNFYLHVPVL